jgi:hypothetical protein
MDTLIGFLFCATVVAQAFAQPQELQKESNHHNSTGQSYASYQVAFSFVWKEKEPIPLNDTEHFSPVVGCIHKKLHPFLRIGEYASKGVEDVAETGNTTKIVEELTMLEKNGTCGERIGPYGPVESPGNMSFEILVTRQYPRVSLISMIAPSPDWFTGTRNGQLCCGLTWGYRTGTFNVDFRDGKRWKKLIHYKLKKYDAGTEEGRE